MAETYIRSTARVTAAKRFWRKAALATLAAGLTAIPGFAQGGSGSGTATLICSVPVLPTGTTSMVGVAQLNCGAPGGALTASNVQFAVEATIPLSYVLASPQPTLPGDIFTSLQQGNSEIRQFVSFSGNVLTIDLTTVPTGTPIPTPATATAPPGTLLTEIRIQVQNVIVTDGPPQTMLFSGIVLPGSTSGTGSTGSTGTTATPLVPNLFGNLTGRAAAVSLAFNSTITFPGLGTTPVTDGTGTGTATGGTGMFNGGNGASAQATMAGVLVAGSFVFSSPAGFVALSFPSGSGSTGGGGGTSGGGPVIVFAPVQSPTASPVIQLDASPTAAGANGPLTYSWEAVGSPKATVLNANTATPTVIFFGPSNYVIQLTVTDALGRSSTAQITIQYIGVPPR